LKKFFLVTGNYLFKNDAEIVGKKFCFSKKRKQKHWMLSKKRLMEANLFDAFRKVKFFEKSSFA
tara:strand:+ start:327 stop:518 length:192 start_codon:yes stop_codon:yes gene_type:complete